jgi:hypothetical protein
LPPKSTTPPPVLLSPLPPPAVLLPPLLMLPVSLALLPLPPLLPLPLLSSILVLALTALCKAARRDSVPAIALREVKAMCWKLSRLNSAASSSYREGKCTV